MTIPRIYQVRSPRVERRHVFLGRAPTGGQSCAYSPPTQGLTRSVANAVQRSNVTCKLTQWALQDATRKSGTQATHLLLVTLLTSCNEFRSTTPSLRPVRVRNESPRSLTADYQFIRAAGSSICNGDFHLDSGLDADGSDLLDDLGRAVQVNEALVDPHLETVPSLRTFPAGGFPRRYSQGLQQKTENTRHPGCGSAALCNPPAGRSEQQGCALGPKPPGGPPRPGAPRLSPWWASAPAPSP